MENLEQKLVIPGYRALHQFRKKNKDKSGDQLAKKRLKDWSRIYIGNVFQQYIQKRKSKQHFINKVHSKTLWNQVIPMPGCRGGARGRGTIN